MYDFTREWHGFGIGFGTPIREPLGFAFGVSGARIVR